MSRLDDIFGKKKEAVPVLDLSKSTATNKEEFKRLMEKVPDYKMRAIKVRAEDIKIKDKDWSFKTPKKENRQLIKNNGLMDPSAYTYMDPVPQEMASIVLMELCTIQIDWRMLTTARPKTKTEEEYFSKLVELGKLQIKTEAREKRELIQNPFSKKVKNRSGIVETRIITCNDCLEEFCNSNYCSDFNYDLYLRVPVKQPVNKDAVLSEREQKKLMRQGMAKPTTAKKGKKGKESKPKKKKKRSKSKSPSRKSD
uniref:CSON007785 protein n=1 Tax=Culicoides sonorensis TaxID=179676 RepID=A0A336LXV4_CULSO